jgi:cysteine-rich repeat protein
VTSPSTCVTICGDHYLITPLGEQCEDGNTVNLDGCSSTCLKEAGWTHVTSYYGGLANTVSTPICGDS